MAKIQTRRSISISGALYAQVQRRCQQQRRPMSAYVTQLIEADLGIAQPRRLPAETPNVQTLPKPEAKHDPKPVHSHRKNDPFTF